MLSQLGTRPSSALRRSRWSHSWPSVHSAHALLPPGGVSVAPSQLYQRHHKRGYSLKTIGQLSSWRERSAPPLVSPSPLCRFTPFTMAFISSQRFFEIWFDRNSRQCMATSSSFTSPNGPTRPDNFCSSSCWSAPRPSQIVA